MTVSDTVVGSTPAASDVLRARLDDPQVAASLQNLLDHADLLALLLASLDGVARRSEVIGSSLADSVTELRTLSDSTGAADQLADLAQSVRPLASVAPQLIRGAAHGVTRADTDPVTVRGPVSLVKAMKDPDIAHGMGFVLTLLKSVGAELRATTAASAGKEH